VRRDGNGLVGVFEQEYGGGLVEKRADQIVVEHGTLPLEDLYFALKPLSSNGGAVDYKAFVAGTAQPAPAGQGFRLYRIGDAVASRNIHAAVFDGMRIAKDLA